MAPESVADAIADAILTKGPSGVRIIGRPMSLSHARTIYKWGPLDKPWKVTAAWALAVLASFIGYADRWKRSSAPAG